MVELQMFHTYECTKQAGEHWKGKSHACLAAWKQRVVEEFLFFFTAKVLPLPSYQSSTWGTVHLGSASACWVLGTDLNSPPQGRCGQMGSHSWLYGTWNLFHSWQSTVGYRRKEGGYIEIPGVKSMVKRYTLQNQCYVVILFYLVLFKTNNLLGL